MTFIHFAVGGDRLAVDLSEIREVARVSHVAPVPRAPAVVRGVANIRGRVVTLLDLDVVYGRRADAALPDGAGHAVVLAPPRDHLALFTRSRVNIGRGGVAEVSGEPAAGAAVPSRPPAPGEAPPPGGTLVVCDGVVTHLLPPAEIAAHCEAVILSRYRRRA